MNEPDYLSSNSFRLLMENEMIGLFQSIDGILGDVPKKVIPLMSCHDKEGTSTIIQEFAIVSAMKFQNTVLLLDGALSEYRQHTMFDLENYYTIEDVIQEESLSVYEAFSRVENSGLFLGKIFSGSSPNPYFLTRSGIDEVLEKLHDKFDLILIDSPPAYTSFASNIAISRLVNGIVLVVEAEKTRSPVVSSFATKVESSGGKILGIVFNKRRYHIPDFIYKRL